jgi:uncharacterized surface protein with fasciclin (FAS1) repeats
MPMSATEPKDIVTTAIDDGSFATLATAMQAAGLIDALKGNGPFTVFAPTDAAFAKLPDGTVESLLCDIPRLKAVLMYHVVAGKYMSADVKGKTTLKTLEGRSITLDPSNGVKVGEATVVMPDVQCTNGIIHVIDAVLLPG